MILKLAPFFKQNSNWPQEGRHILAQYDNRSIIVYQAYRPSIAMFAVKQGYFGGEFNFYRMSWIKPNFLWMMYRSGWGTKPGQERVLGVRIKLTFFNSLLEQAVLSSYEPGNYKNETIWRSALLSSSVRIQWDSDHDPKGAKLNRRAIQLGLRNEALKEYSKDAIIEIIDLSEFVKTQRVIVESEDFTK